ncbi:MAG: helix-turn-helix domain-containing protein [Oscillochloris sp.]|nr:helix-turn-helix domain-containing protein [Oscillochloris sp.]
MDERERGQTPAAFSNFGELLRYLRRRAQLTQRDLAIAVDYSESQISRLEQGARQPDLTVLRALFVPALGLEDKPDWAARLLDLASAASSIIRSTGPPANTSGNLSLRAPDHTHVSPLLETKLYLPRPRPDLVHRPHLSAYLDSLLTVPLTLIAAPAGFGKTTLLALWLQQAATPAVWLSLDAGDDDLPTFVRYLVATLQRTLPSAGQGTLALLGTSQPLPAQMLLTPLINDLLALLQDTVLVLDDYHVITSTVVHEVIAFLLAHLPPLLHLVIVSREDPPLPLARLRAGRHLIELRALDLRFSPEETATFLREVMGVTLVPEEIAALVTRTEGWIAGLQLAALALQDRADHRAFIHTFAGNNRYIADYLAAEVLDRLPGYLRTFVLQISILEQMCGPLCDALLGLSTNASFAGAEPLSRAVGSKDEPLSRAVGSKDDLVSTGSYSQLLFDQLERMNLFLVPLDSNRQWYRYHHLFAEVLRARLVSGTSAATVALLHQRASLWLEQHGLIPAAVRHALAAPDFERAAALIEQHALPIAVSGPVHMVLGWLSALPEPLIRARPSLGILYASVLMMTDQLEMTQILLSDIEQALPADLPPASVCDIRGRIALLRAAVVRILGDQPQSVALSFQALELLPETESFWRAIAMVNVAHDYRLSGEVLPSAEHLAWDATAAVRAVGHRIATLRSITNLAQLYVLQGRLHQAAITYEEAAQVAIGPTGLHELVSSPAYYFGLGDLQREWNDLETAALYLRQGMDLVRGSTLTVEADMIVLGYIALARLKQATGDSSGALVTLNEFLRLARQRGFVATLLDHALAARARIWLMQGNLQAAREWADAAEPSLSSDLEYPQESQHLTWVRVRIIEARQGSANRSMGAVLHVLDNLIKMAEANERISSVIEGLILRALVLDLQRDRAGALRALERSLNLAAPEGYVRIFVDEGTPLADLLVQSAKRKVQNSTVQRYIGQLLSAFPDKQLAAAPRAVVATQAPPLIIEDASPLVEPLSEREQTVLRLIAAGHSNQAISEALVIEVGTVKRHVHSLLGKLDAQSRTQAVARARELHIL